MQHITGIPRNQMVFTSLEDSISEDNSVRKLHRVTNFGGKAIGGGVYPERRRRVQQAFISCLSDKTKA